MGSEDLYIHVYIYVHAHIYISAHTPLYTPIHPLYSLGHIPYM